MMAGARTMKKSAARMAPKSQARLAKIFAAINVE